MRNINITYILLSLFIFLETTAVCQAENRTPDKNSSGPTAKQDLYQNESRLALIIGNARYEEHVGNLCNAKDATVCPPVNDANLIAETLIGFGFDTLLYRNLNYVQMKEAIKEFHQRIIDDSIGTALFFYAGHGSQRGDENYLYPVDYKRSEKDTILVGMQEILSGMDKSQYNIVLFDACRTELKTGENNTLAKIATPENTFIGYSTSPGRVALNTGGSSKKNSAFTEILTEQIKGKDVTLTKLFEDVSTAVRDTTRVNHSREQQPFLTSSIYPFYFRNNYIPNEKEYGKYGFKTRNGQVVRALADREFRYAWPFLNGKAVVILDGLNDKQERTLYLQMIDKLGQEVDELDYYTLNNPTERPFISITWDNHFEETRSKTTLAITNRLELINVHDFVLMQEKEQNEIWYSQVNRIDGWTITDQAGKQRSEDNMLFFGSKSMKKAIGIIDGLKTDIYITKNGLIAYAISDFSDSLALVRSINDDHGFIDKTGKWAFNFDEKEIQGIGLFHEGLAQIKKNDGNYGFVDKKGQLVIDLYEVSGVGNFSEGLAQINKENGESAYINKNGDIVIDHLNYSEMGRFSGGLALVVKDYGYIGYINKNGREVVSGLDYLDNAYFYDGLAAVMKRKGGYGYIDKTGELVIDSLDYWYVGNFSKGLAPVKQRNGELGYINKNTDIVLPSLKYESVGNFSEGLAPVRKQPREYGYINQSGELVIDKLSYEVVGFFSDGLARVRKTTGQFGFINQSGELVIDYLEFEEVFDFSDGLARIGKTTGQFGFINQSGVLVIDYLEFKEVFDFSDGLALVQKRNGEYGFINKRGELVLDGFDFASFFIEGFASAKKNGNSGIINKEGDFVIENNEYTFLMPFSEGLVLGVDKDRKPGHFNELGQLVLDHAFVDVGIFSDGLARVKFHNLAYGYIDKTGSLVIDNLEYNEVNDFNNGVARVVARNKNGYINKQGEIVIPIIYDEISQHENGFLAKIEGQYILLDQSGKLVKRLQLTNQTFEDWDEYQRVKEQQEQIPKELPFNELKDLPVAFQTNINRDYVGILGQKGQLLPFEGSKAFTAVERLRPGLWKYERNNSVGILTTDGYFLQELIPANYEEIRHFKDLAGNERFHLQQNDGTYLIADEHGKIIYYCLYKSEFDY